jgi:N utilization substance protein A
MFVEALNVEEVIAHLLVTEGFTSVEEVAFVPLEDLAGIEGFDEDVAAELNQRANDYLESKSEEAVQRLKEMGVEDNLLNFEAIDIDMVKIIAPKGIKTLDDLADLASDELIALLPKDKKISEDEANVIIMKAREHWFAGDAA